jgi:dipeptidyl-peptidase-4
VESGPYEVKAITSVNAATQTLWYLAFDGATGQQQVWAVQFDGSNKRQITQRPGYHEPDFAAHNGDFIDKYSAQMTPPSVAACTSTGACTVFWHSKPITGHRIIAPENLVLTAADGTTKLYGTLLLPPNRRANHSVPLIVNPYGGPDVGAERDEWGGKSFLFDQLMAQHGFAILHVDNRGMGGRGRAFEQVCYHNFGPPQFADQMASVDQVLRRYPQLDPHRLGWWGWSWGGSFTLFALSHSSSFLAGVAVAPVTNWRNYDSIYTERYMGLPTEDADNYHEDSDVNSAANLHGHILIMHGTGDDNVHPSNTVQYIQKLIDARIPYDLNLFPRKTHSIAGPNDRTILFNKIVSYFEQYVMNPGESTRTEEQRHHERRR